MSLSKAIKSGKEHRKPYYGAASFDSSCRPGGGCPWCEGNRFHADRRRRAAADEQIKEWEKGRAAVIDSPEGEDFVKHPYYDYTTEDAMCLARTLIENPREVADLDCKKALKVISSVAKRQRFNWITGQMAQEVLRLTMGEREEEVLR